jgi:hypothetical protein
MRASENKESEMAAADLEVLARPVQRVHHVVGCYGIFTTGT